MIENQLKYLIEKSNSIGSIPIKIQALDPELLVPLTTIALNEYAREKIENHGNITQVFLGLIGEYAFKELLKKNKIDAIHNEMERLHWATEKATTDFRLVPSNIGLEICTTPPTDRYRYGMVKASKLNRKDWEFAVFMKLNSLEYDCLEPMSRQWYHIDASNPSQMFTAIPKPNKELSSTSQIIGDITLRGFATREEIELGFKNRNISSDSWRFSAKGMRITPFCDAIIRELTNIENSGQTAIKLLNKLKSEKIAKYSLTV